MLLAFFFSLIIAMGTALDFFFRSSTSSFAGRAWAIYDVLVMTGGSNLIHDLVTWVKAAKGKTDSSKENGEKHEGLTGVLKSAHTKFSLTPRSGASTHGAGLRPGLPEPIVGKGTTRVLGDGLEGFEVSFRRVKAAIGPICVLVCLPLILQPIH